MKDTSLPPNHSLLNEESSQSASGQVSQAFYSLKTIQRIEFDLRSKEVVSKVGLLALPQLKACSLTETLSTPTLHSAQVE